MCAGQEIPFQYPISPDQQNRVSIHSLEILLTSLQHSRIAKHFDQVSKQSQTPYCTSLSYIELLDDP